MNKPAQSSTVEKCFLFVCSHRWVKRKWMASLNRCASRCSARWNRRPWRLWTCPAASEPAVTVTCEPSRPVTPRTMTASPPWAPPSPPPSGRPQVRAFSHLHKSSLWHPGCCLYSQINTKSLHLVLTCVNGWTESWCNLVALSKSFISLHESLLYVSIVFWWAYEYRSHHSRAVLVHPAVFDFERSICSSIGCIRVKLWTLLKITKWKLSEETDHDCFFLLSFFVDTFEVTYCFIANRLKKWWNCSMQSVHC